MNEALRIYGPKAITWTPYDEASLAAARESGKLVLLAFASDSKDSEATLKALEDRSIAKSHEKILFLKADYVKDGHAEKLWGVSYAPTILVVDPTKEAGSKAVIDRVTGKKSAASLRGTIEKGLRAVEK